MATARPSDELLVRAGRALLVLCLLLFFSAPAVALIGTDASLNFELVAAPINGLWGTVLFWMLLGAQPRNRVVWLFIALGNLAGLGVFADAVVTRTTSVRGLPEDPTGVPLDELGLAGAVAVFLGEALPFASFAPLLTLALAWFPDGRDLSRRWSIIPWMVGLGLALVIVNEASETWPFRVDGIANLGEGDEVFHRPAALENTDEVGALLVAAAAVLSVASLIARYRTSGAEVRRQIRWVLWAATIGLTAMITTALTPAREGDVVAVLTWGLIFTAYTVAILKHRLFDVDVVITKSLMAAGLVAVVTAAYVGIVIVFPRLAFDTENDGIALPLLATAVVAVLFEPVRERLRAGSERLVYGRRASPLQVLSQLATGLSSAPAHHTDDLAEVVADGTGAEEVTVWVRHGESLIRHGYWSRRGDPPPASSDQSPPVDDELGVTRMVRHDGEPLGAISIAKHPGDPINAADVELLDAVAGPAGLLMRHLGLDAQLHQRAAEVRASRHRVVELQDAERRRLERDLHDGAQQQLTGLRVKLGVAGRLAERRGDHALTGAISELAGTVQVAVDSTRMLAHGIYPPALEVEGLGPTLSSIAVDETIDLRIERQGLGRLPIRVEETLYFCVIELLEEVRRSGGGQLHLDFSEAEEGVILAAYADVELSRSATSAISDRVLAAGGRATVAPGAARRLQIVLDVEEPSWH